MEKPCAGKENAYENGPDSSDSGSHQEIHLTALAVSSNGPTKKTPSMATGLRLSKISGRYPGFL
jgi:hypothetical protein